MTMEPFDVLGHLRKRRSHPAASLAEPAPQGAALQAILEAEDRESSPEETDVPPPQPPQPLRGR